MLLSDSIYHSIGDGQTKSDNEIINADDPGNSGKLNELIKNS